MSSNLAPFYKSFLGTTPMKLHRCRLILAVLLLLIAPVFATAQAAPAPKPSAATAASSAAKLDINSCTAEQLKALPGIGDAYTKRIIDGRPYTAKNQLVSRGVITAGTYEKIKDQIIASHPKK
jgi:DNA uptake protein ComE-like DNA-binding protein